VSDIVCCGTVLVSVMTCSPKATAVYFQPSRGATTGQAPSYHSEPRVWGPRSSSSCSCTCICITNHFFSLTDTAASASAILLQQQCIAVMQKPCGPMHFSVWDSVQVATFRFIIGFSTKFTPLPSDDHFRHFLTPASPAGSDRNAVVLQLLRNSQSHSLLPAG
jgi:hypothetical protein